MIHIKSIRNVNYNDYDTVWAIVRSMKHPSDKITQVTALSPSPSLFVAYRGMVAQNTWNHQSFQDIYVPQFLYDLKHSNEQPKQYLNKLWQLDKAGKNICLTCFCPDETMCHRSIIAGLLQGVGCNVKTDTGNDYTKYYEQYINIK